MTDWNALAKARGLGIPNETLQPLVLLEEAFEPLKAKLPFTLEPAITLNESAVLGRNDQKKGDSPWDTGTFSHP